MKNSFPELFRNNSKKGSILLEIAVGISILTIISGFIVRKSMAANKYIREQQTKSNINTVVISIASFVANNQRLPRPSAANDGIENESENLNSDTFLTKLWESPKKPQRTEIFNLLFILYIINKFCL